MATGQPEPPLPEPTPESAEWWSATSERRFVIQRCRNCEHWQHYPRALCLGCGGFDLGFAPASGRGVIHSYTEIHRAPLPSLSVPYVVALIRLAEGPMMLSAIVDSAPDQIRCEAPVELAWRPLADGRNLPVFKVTG